MILIDGPRMVAKVMWKERRLLSTGTESSPFGWIKSFFVKPNGHGLGDRWSFTARPANLVVSKYEQDSLQQTQPGSMRGMLCKKPLNSKENYDLLSFRTSTEGSTDKLYLQHDMDRMLTSSPVVSGDILGH